MHSEMTTLSNGLRIISSYRPELETVSVGAWVKTGAAQEKKSINGISHFVEHMVFKGTATRTLEDISDQIENAGGQINAYTAREFTAFYARMLKDDAELALDVIADMLQHPSFPQSELDKERDVVIQEIKQGRDTPDEVVFDYMQECAFPGQGLGSNILGPEANIRRFTREDLYSYLESNYAAENIVVCAVGNITHEKFVQYAAARFSEFRPRVSFVSEPQRYIGGFKVEKRDIEQAHVAVAFESYPYYNNKYFAAMLLSNVMGGGTSSRLFREIRDKRGLVYSVYSFANSHTGSGLFGVYAGTTAGELPTLMPVLCDEIDKVCSEKVTPQELHRAQVQMKSAVQMSMESSASVAEILARQQLIYDRIIPVEEMVEEIEAVTADDIMNAAQHIFVTPPSYALVGAFDGHMSYDELAERFRVKNA